MKIKIKIPKTNNAKIIRLGYILKTVRSQYKIATKNAKKAELKEIKALNKWFQDYSKDTDIEYKKAKNNKIKAKQEKKNAHIAFNKASIEYFKAIKESKYGSK